MSAKRIAAMLMSILLTSGLCGCGNNTVTEFEYDQEETVSQENDQILSMFREELYVFRAGCTVKGVTRSGNTMMVYGADNGTPVLGLIEYCVDENGALDFSETRLLNLDNPDDEREARIYAITTGEDGNFYVLTGELPRSYTINGIGYYNDDYKGNFAVIKYASTGEFINSYKIDNWPSGDVAGLVAAKDGMLIYGSSYVSFISWEENSISTELFDAENIITAASLTSEGPIVSSYNFSQAKAHYYSCDILNGSMAELKVSSVGEGTETETGNWSVCQGLSGEYLLNSGTTFVSCSFKDERYMQIFQWDYGRTPLNDCNYVSRISEYGFACAISGTEYLLITGMVLDKAVEQTTVIVALCGDEAAGAIPILDEMNSTNTKYRYDYTHYGSSSVSKALIDISSSASPDLILYCDNIDTSSDAFEDLYAFIDSDTELGRDSFLPNYLQALTIYGELHELWTGTVINTVAARAADIGRETELSPNYYTELLMENNNYEAVFDSYMSKENLLKWVAALGVNLYIDKENGTCDFASQSFAELLTWCNDMGNEIPEGSSVIEPLDISEVILSLEIISSPERVAYIREMFGEPFTFVGFPIGNNTGSYYSCPEGCFRMAIPKNSANKSGAWEFIKQQVSYSTQLQSYFNLPVNYDAFYRNADAKLNDEELQQLIDLTKNTLYAENVSDSPVKEIIMECGRSFIAGDKSIEETVATIQSRAELYLAERS